MQFHLYNLMMGACLAIGCAAYAPVPGDKFLEILPGATADNPKPEVKVETKSFAVAELFSSEGCISCSPAYRIAERMLGRAARDGKHVYLLDYHVDYWNEKGWADPFSKRQFTDRQRRYATVFSGSGLYTPQMVVNGSAEVIGSDEVRVHRAVKRALDAEATYGMRISHAVSTRDSMLVDYALSAVPDNGVINVALVQEKVESEITGGKQAGKKLVHYCVVREMETYPAMERSGRIQVPLIQGNTEGSFSVVVFLQDPGTMKVLAADAYKLMQSPVRR